MHNSQLDPRVSLDWEAYSTEQPVEAMRTSEDERDKRIGRMWNAGHELGKAKQRSAVPQCAAAFEVGKDGLGIGRGVCRW